MVATLLRTPSDFLLADRHLAVVLKPRSLAISHRRTGHLCMTPPSAPPRPTPFALCSQRSKVSLSTSHIIRTFSMAVFITESTQISLIERMEDICPPPS